MSNRRPPAAGQGKRKGTLNRTTKTVREIYTLFVQHNAEGAQALYDRIAKKNPVAALSLLAKISEFILPKLARIELGVTLQPDTSGIFSGTPITAESASAAYLAIMGAPIGTDLSRLVFEVPAAPQATAAQVAAQPADWSQPEPAQPASVALDPEVLSDYRPAIEPLTEPVEAPSNITNIADWERLGK